MKLLAKVVRSNNGTPQFEVKYKDHPYRVKLFKFQENYPDDSPIECTVVKQANGDLFLRQDLQSLINEYFTAGEVYEFSVKHDFSHNGYYELVDERGIPFRLAVPKGMKLLTGSSVRCRLLSVDTSGGQLKLEDTSVLFECEKSAKNSTDPQPVTTRKELDATVIANRVFNDLYPVDDPEWDPDILFNLLFINDDYYAQAVSRSILEIIRQWRSEQIGWDKVATLLTEMTTAIMYVLEGSDTLLGVEPLQRKSLQKRLSILADNVRGYCEAVDLLGRERVAEEVTRVLDSLRKSGYIYEAERQLDKIMRIFSLASDVMAENMTRIFDIIHSRSEDFWHDEPFRKAFIRMLQIYVDQSRTHMEESGDDNEATVRSLIEALSIQLLLADREADADLFDYNLNMASLCRYASMLRTSEPANAIRNAFLALMDVSRRPASIYRWSETGAHDLLASKLTASPVGLEGGFEKWYTNRQIELTIDTNSITISRNDVKSDTLKPLDLPEVGVWRNLKILTPQKIARPTDPNLKRVRDMWNAVETSLFSEDLNIKRPLTRRLATPGKDDECFIRITHQIDDGLFGVEVTDEDYEGRGTISVEDMVKYKVPGLRMEHFLNNEGKPMVFLARVKRVEEGQLIFSIYENITRYSHDMIENDNELICVIKSSNQYGIVGISTLGDAVRFKREGEAANLHVGDVVRANYWTRPENPSAPYIDGIVTGLEPNFKFSTELAFRQLILDYSDGNYYDSPEEEVTSAANTASSEDMLSDQRLGELMALVERQAAGESDYIKAYNHIGFARLLARIGRCDEKREFYEAWMRLISILHYFAVNGKIDDAQLAEFEANDRSRFDNRSELYRRYLQLKIVSYKGQPQMRDTIWHYMADEDEEIRSLATNVMAYNLIAENVSASALGEIEDRINNILHVNARKSTLHSFGAENKTREFKSSLIFPPNNHMRANPEAQTVEIMKELCALLNADGGTLYLGVNDFGMGVGIENDLAYRDFNGSEDKYDLYFRHSVCRILGNDVDAYVDGRFETFGGKRIYIVTVKPYYTSPVKVDGVIYERHGSSKLPFYNPEDIRRFTERRAEEREIHRAATATATQAPVTTKNEEQVGRKSPSEAPVPEVRQNVVAESPVSGTEKNMTNSSPETPARVNPEKIATGLHRPVCPASYEPEQDVATVRYLQMLKDGFQLVPDFYGYADDPELLLTLPIREEDSRNWLVLGYADGSICRIAMRPVLDKSDYTPGVRYNDSDLIFADILSDEDAILSLSLNNSGNWNARADRIDQLPEVAGLRNAGERLFNVAKEKYLFNVIYGAACLNYPDLFNRTPKDAGKNFSINRQDRLYQQLHRDGYIDED